MTVTKLVFDNLVVATNPFKVSKLSLPLVVLGLISGCCSSSKLCLTVTGYGIQAKIDYRACPVNGHILDRVYTMSNVQTLVALRAELVNVLNGQTVEQIAKIDRSKLDDDAKKLLDERMVSIGNLNANIEKLEKGFAHEESFVPKGWREVTGRVDPLPLAKAGAVTPIDDATIAKLPQAMADDVVHSEFAKGTTIKQFMIRLKGKTFFTLPELASACGFDNTERNLNQIVGSASFRSVIGSFALKGRIVKAKKGPGQGATSNENVKSIAVTLDL